VGRPAGILGTLAAVGVHRALAVAACVAAAGAGLAVPAGAGAAAYAPPPGQVYAGVTGGLQRSDYTSFTALTGRHAAVWQVFLTWDQDRGENPYLFLRTRLAMARELGARMALSLSTARQDGSERIAPAGIARGDGDPYLLGLNRELGAAGDVTYVRPYAEMNQGNNVWSAFSAAGGRRGGGHSTTAFVRAWKRTVLILRGGDVAAIDRQLASLHMPPVRTGAAALPASRTSFVWCPQVAGDPDVSGNSPRAYWPGNAWVDWIGTDFYSGFPNWSGLARFYRSFARTGKPFAFGEWGIWQSGDAPGFFRAFLRWVQAHPRVGMVLLNQGNEAGGSFRLQRYPRAAGVLRSGLRSPRFRAYP
jgi:hypothetical protein